MSSCSDDKVDRQGQDLLINQGMYYLYNSETDKAIAYLNALITNYPFIPESKDASLILMWLYFQNNQNEGALALIEKYRKEHPYDKSLQWVDYLESMIDFTNISSYRRSGGTLEKSLQSLQMIIDKYPATRYGIEATFKISSVRYMLGAKHMEIARFYLNHHNKLAAILRFQEVVKYFNNTVVVIEALNRLVYLYISIKDYDEAYKYLRTSVYNYPNNEWTYKSIYLYKTYVPKELQKKLNL